MTPDAGTPSFHTANGAISAIGHLHIDLVLHSQLPKSSHYVAVIMGDAPFLIGLDILHAYGAVHDHRLNPSVYTIHSPIADEGIKLKRSYWIEMQDEAIFESALCTTIPTSVGVQLYAQPTIQADTPSIKNANRYIALAALDDSQSSESPEPFEIIPETREDLTRHLSDLEYMQAVFGPTAEDIDNDLNEGELDPNATKTIEEILLDPARPHAAPITAEQETVCRELLCTHADTFLRPGEISQRPPNFPDDLKFKVDFTREPTCKARSRPTSQLERQAWVHAINRLLDGDLIERAPVSCPTSSWASMLVKADSDGKVANYRIVIDTREVNKCVKPDVYNLPLISDLLRKASEAKYKIVFDLQNGFFNVRMDDPKTKQAYAIRTPLGTFLLKVCPQGPANGPAMMQRFIDSRFQPLIIKGVVITYLDDLCVLADDMDTLLDALKEVFIIMDKYNLKFKLKKVQFCVTVATILGHTVGYKSYGVHEDKCRAIREFTPPLTVTEMRSFVGLCEQFRPFVPKISYYLKFFTSSYDGNVTRKSRKRITWTPEMQSNFQELLSVLSSPPVLREFQLGLETRVYADASDRGAGAVLYQREKDSAHWHLVACWSHMFTGSEKGWDTTHKETYAIYWSICREWHWMLQPCSFIAYTDHMPVIFILSKHMDQLKGYEWRWAHRLSQFDVKITHTPGAQNTVADALSRHLADPVITLCVFDLYAGGGTNILGLLFGTPPNVKIAYYPCEIDDWNRAVCFKLLADAKKRCPGKFLDVDHMALGTDVRLLTPDILRELIPSGAYSFLMAGPPCQSFSRANSQALGLMDDREGFSWIAPLLSAVTFFHV